MKKHPLSTLLHLAILVCALVTGCCVQRQITLDGTNKLSYVRPEWFGAINDGKTDCTEAIQKMFDYMSSNNIYVCKFKPCSFEIGEFYLVSKTINISKSVKIEGRKAFISSREVIHYGSDPNNKFYWDNGVALNFIGEDTDNPRLTDICINIKVHAKPFFFSRLKNAYVHDCYVSTYTGDTTATKGKYTYWFAFQCDEMSCSRFKNIHIDQPPGQTRYNSSDGIHLSGGCHDIFIDHVYGQAGDDFIALNTNENHSGDIYNITIRNCSIGKDVVSNAGLRFYGCSRLSHANDKPQLSISNVRVENCYIRTDLSPCIFFTNNTDWRKNDPQSHKLNISNVTIKKCTLLYESKRYPNIPAIWLGGTECNNLLLDRVVAIKDNRVPLLGLEGQNNLNELIINRCGQDGSRIIVISVKNEPGFLETNTSLVMKDEGVVSLPQREIKRVVIKKGVITNLK